MQEKVGTYRTSVLVLCAIKLEVTYRDPNMVFQVSEISKELFSQCHLQQMSMAV